MAKKGYWSSPKTFPKRAAERMQTQSRPTAALRVLIRKLTSRLNLV